MVGRSLELRARRWLANGLRVAAGVMLVLCALRVSMLTSAATARAPENKNAADSTKKVRGAGAPVVTYRMSVEVDPERHDLRATGRVRWRNRSNKPQKELYVHLYLNAFRDAASRFMRSKLKGFRGGARPSRWASIDVTRFYVKRFKRDLWPPPEERHTPGDPKDGTDIRVALPEAIEPGEELEIEMAWKVSLPSVVLRTGFVDQFHMVAQWFPKLARLEEDGTWAHFPFERLSEFYADFGEYDVTITAPNAYVIAAPGNASPPERGPEKTRQRYRLSPAHDFAFAVSDDLALFERKTEDGVRLRCFVPSGQDVLAHHQLDVVNEALPYFQKRYGDYPYESLTIVHPPLRASEAGGMEYPGLITTGGRRLPFEMGVRTLAAVTVHELAHQWFYGLLASNEHRWPFLDEGLTTFVQAEWMGARWPDSSAASVQGIEISIAAINRAHAADAWGKGPIARAAAEFESGDDYGPLVYGGTASLLETLARVHGRERVARVLSSYARQQRMAHPTPDELLSVLEEEFGRETAAWFRAALFDGKWLDWNVRFDGPSAVVVERAGGLPLGVNVQLIDEAGERHLRRVDSKSTSQRLDLGGGRALVAAVVDPEHQLVIDANLSNNAISREAQVVAPRVWNFAQVIAQLLVAGAYP